MPHECTNCGRVFADGSKEMLSGCPNCGGNKFQFRPPSATDSGPDGDTHERSHGGGAASGSPDSDSAATDTSGPDSPGRDSGTPSAESNAWSGTADRALDDQGETAADSSREWVNERRDDAADRDSAADRDVDSTSTTEPEPSPTADSDAAVDRDPASDPTPPEDTAQASARSDVVSPDEIPAAGPDGSDIREGGTAPPGSDSPDREGPPTDADGRVIEPSSDERPDLDDLREELNEQFESIRIVAPGEYELNLMELYDRTEYIISLQEDGRYVIEVPDTWDTTPDPGEDA